MKLKYEEQGLSLVRLNLKETKGKHSFYRRDNIGACDTQQVTEQVRENG